VASMVIDRYNSSELKVYVQGELVADMHVSKVGKAALTRAYKSAVSMATALGMDLVINDKPEWLVVNLASELLGAMNNPTGSRRQSDIIADLESAMKVASANNPRK